MVAQRSRVKTDGILKKMLKSRGLCRQGFFKHVRRISNKRRVKDRNVHGVLVVSKASSDKCRNKSPFFVYRQLHWDPSVTVGTRAVGPEIKRSKSAYERLSDARKGHYEALAAERTKELNNVLDLARVGPTLPTDMDKQDMRALKNKAHDRALKNLFDERCWAAGSALDEPWHGLRPELVDVQSSFREIDRRVRQYFRYSDVHVSNPTGKAMTERACPQLYGGLCKADDEVDMCACLVSTTCMCMFTCL